MKKLILLIASIFIFQNFTIAGGGWPQAKGKGYYKLSQWWIVADQHYTDLGFIDPNVTSGIFNTSFYGEYGVTNRLTAIANVPFFSRAFNNNIVSGTTGEILAPGDAINSFGDTNIGIKYGLKTKGKVRVSSTLTLGLPLGNSAGGIQENLQTGDGEFNQILQLDASRGLQTKSLSLYGTATAGINNRTKGFSDEFQYGLEVGAGLFKERVWLIGRLTGTESFKNGNLASDVSSTSVFANNSEFTSLSAEVTFYLTKKVGVSASYASAVRGEIIFASPSYSVGVFLDLSK